MDLFNGEIVSYATKDRPTYALVKEMLNDALLKLGGADRYDKNSKNNENSKRIIHSDRGWHYQMHQYQQTLKEQGLTQSMSRKGNCLDDAMIERLEGTPKKRYFMRQPHLHQAMSLKPPLMNTYTTTIMIE
ncbi:Integrase core domain [Moraxella caprae]|uniref:Integrase core domain n=1 Tax=Moraxella caprae TaxID=90240 RepID=A0A378U564_9GAMM|nr:Integrase core domain [Moraxella caprae]STZ70297.1 Integrase core domain [Moraxella caprae]